MTRLLGSSVCAVTDASLNFMLTLQPVWISAALSNTASSLLSGCHAERSMLQAGPRLQLRRALHEASRLLSGKPR